MTLAPTTLLASLALAVLACCAACSGGGSDDYPITGTTSFIGGGQGTVSGGSGTGVDAGANPDGPLRIDGVVFDGALHVDALPGFDSGIGSGVTLNPDSGFGSAR